VTRRLVAFLVLAAAGLGCRNTADGAREDARKAAREAEQAAREAKKAAREAKKDLDRAAREAQRAADDARKDVREAMGDARTAMREAQSAVRQASREAGRDAREAAAELNGAKQLVDVRAALAVSKEISSGSDISVSGDEPGRTVILSGTVPTAAEKDAAGRIARASADGLRVENRLKVASR
jgi:predicted small secreted protein